MTANRAGTIRYTTDGSNPSVTTQEYSEPLLLTAATTLKFFAVDTAGTYPEVVKTESYTIKPTVQGDCTGDGIVNVFDALLTLQYAVGLIPHSMAYDVKYKTISDVAPLDTNGKPMGDGQVNVFDALAILRHAVGLDGW